MRQELDCHSLARRHHRLVSAASLLRAAQECHIFGSRVTKPGMPLGQKEGALIGTGTGLAAATVYFYRRKQTLPFKVIVLGWLQP